VKDISVVEEESVLWRVFEWFMLYVKKNVVCEVVCEEECCMWRRGEFFLLSVVIEMEANVTIVYKYFARALARVLPLANRDKVVAYPTWVAFAGLLTTFQHLQFARGFLWHNPWQTVVPPCFSDIPRFFSSSFEFQITSHSLPRLLCGVAPGKFARSFPWHSSWQICQGFLLLAFFPGNMQDFL